MMRTAVFTAHLFGGPHDGRTMSVGAVREIVINDDHYKIRAGTAALIPGRLDYDWVPR